MENPGKYFKGIIPPPIVFFLLILIAFIAKWKYPFDLIFYKWSTRLILGLPILLLAGIIAFNALTVMKKYQTAINFNNPTTKLIVEGSFRFTRNPLYLSLLLAMATVVILANSGWHLIAFILLFLFFNFGVVAREELYLENSFGKDYTQYKNSVRRWI